MVCIYIYMVRVNGTSTGKRRWNIEWRPGRYSHGGLIGVEGLYQNIVF